MLTEEAGGEKNGQLSDTEDSTKTCFTGAEILRSSSNHAVDRGSEVAAVSFPAEASTNTCSLKTSLDLDFMTKRMPHDGTSLPKKWQNENGTTKEQGNSLRELLPENNIPETYCVRNNKADNDSKSILNQKLSCHNSTQLPNVPRPVGLIEVPSMFASRSTVPSKYSTSVTNSPSISAMSHETRTIEVKCSATSQRTGSGIFAVAGDSCQESCSSCSTQQSLSPSMTSAEMATALPSGGKHAQLTHPGLLYLLLTDSGHWEEESQSNSTQNYTGENRGRVQKTETEHTQGSSQEAGNLEHANLNGNIKGVQNYDSEVLWPPDFDVSESVTHVIEHGNQKTVKENKDTSSSKETEDLENFEKGCDQEDIGAKDRNETDTASGK